MAAAIPSNESQRLAKLKSYQVLDTAEDKVFSNLVTIVAKALNVPIAFISFIDEERQWNKAAVGLAEKEIYRGLSFCAHALSQSTPFIVKSTLDDERFAQHPHVTSKPQLRFYAGFPLMSPEGLVMGCLAVADQKTRSMSDDEVEFMTYLAAHIVEKLEGSIKSEDVSQNLSRLEKARPKLERDSLILETLIKLCPEVIYLYNYATKEVKYLNSIEQLPFPQSTAALASPDFEEALTRFNKFREKNLVEFSYRVPLDKKRVKQYEIKEHVIGRNAESVPQEVLGVAVNTTALKEKQERADDLTAKLRQSSQMFTSVLNSITEGIIVVDELGNFVHYNSTAENLLGIGMSMANSTLWSSSYGYFYADQKTPMLPDEKPLAKALKGQASENVEIFVRNSQIPKGAMLVMNALPLVDDDKSIRGAIVTFHNITQIKTAEAKLANLSQTDDLTKLPNARALISYLEQRTQNSPNVNFALAIIDIDQFQRINSFHGTPAGDRVIQGLGRILKWRMRKQDFMGRLKADEFYMVLSDVDQTSAQRLAEGLKKAVEEAKEAIPFTVSIGMSYFSGIFQAENIEQIIKAADDAVYKAKTSNRL